MITQGQPLIVLDESVIRDHHVLGVEARGLSGVFLQAAISAEAASYNEQLGDHEITLTFTRTSLIHVATLLRQLADAGVKD